ncbi:ATP-binding protein [uncultured Oceanicaulis sp.]|uniref:ATP-binding protein n=1 Tax=uncultured Oceanicaulis sp. TaxID=259940 RepID=UPI00267F86FB|tara:strand:+ start:2458 stop:4092 length:1635 start_codon:yes stop_codon:yes gene_type:complete
MRDDLMDLRNEPDPSRLIYGLRDTGYTFNTAAADIVDNSIAAGADEVNVRIELQADGRKFVYFGDNGQGMDRAKLSAAMRYGAPQRENLASLGKFGLGLKTASSAICLRYTVISRSDPTDPLHKLAWDLEHVADRDQWEMLSEPVSADEEEVFEELCGETGTLVIWSKCDRLLAKNYDEPGGTKEKRAVTSLIQRLKDHFALIYYRFLDASDERERNVLITVNDEPVEAWNPFYPEKSEQVLAPSQQEIEIELEDGSIEHASIKAWILPHSKDISKEENDTKAKITNRAQGFYIHREGRIIQQGGWLHVFGSPEPHTSLLRIEFDFSHTLDSAFNVDVKKSQILFDPALEEGLRELLRPVYREAGSRYRRTMKAAAVEKGVDHGSSNRSIESAKTAKKPNVLSADSDSQTAIVSNNRGPNIRLRVPVQNNVDPLNVYVDAVTDITSGRLWEPAMRSTTSDGHVASVRVNKHHDFYQKIYLKAAALGYAVEGMDLLLWALSTAEQNNTDEELSDMFEDIRTEVSQNLEKLLRDVPMPSERDLDEL